jgi:PAS domain S-box-containing protein
MTSEAPSRDHASGYLPPLFSIPPAKGRSFPDPTGKVELSPRLRAELLDLDAWAEILTAYGRTMRVAVALTDADGHVLGKCHNPQPVWTLVHQDAHDWTGCPFCISKGVPCTAVAEALRAGGVVRVRDQAGLTHVAVPLLLGKQQLGAIIAGQVFDRYPDQLPLRRVAKEFGVSAPQLWDIARRQRPVSSASLQASADLLLALGEAFLRQRHGAILEAMLAETNGHFRLLVDSVRDHALFTIDPVGRVTSWNVGADRMFGYLDAEIVGQNFSCLFTPEDIQNHVPERQLNKASRAGRIEGEGWCLRAGRKQFWADVNITSLSDDAGPVRGFAVIVQDMTERRKLVTVMEEAVQERARVQEKLLSHVSHELRTPLTAIYLFTTNVLDGLLGDINPEQHDQLALAVENVNQLKRMVSDLLDITRVETHKLTVEPRQVFLDKLIADVLTTCQTNAALKNISLSSDVKLDLSFVWADPDRLRQVLINLIDNGIKFTPESGTVTVRSRLCEEDDGFLRISVSDTGCGISPENCELVFERLAQIKSGTPESRSGLGLGLFIARDLVSRQGGRIWVESQLGRGSNFHLTLPVFSLAKLCAHVFTAPNLEAGHVTLIAVDVVPLEGTVEANIVPEIRRVLERCIHPGQDVLLPPLRDGERIENFFIVACTDANGFAVISRRIGRELQDFALASKLKPAISSATLLIAPGQSREEQISGIMARVERLVQAHLTGKTQLT